MILRFKFIYKSSDKTLSKFLDFACKKFDCSYKIFQRQEEVFLYVESSEELINLFLESISSLIPMSIYYYNVEVELVEKIPENSSISLNEEKIISFCPSCLKEVEDEENKNYYNAFKSCELCHSWENPSFIFENKRLESSKRLFEDIAKLINENKKIKIRTLSGTFIFSKLKNLENSTNLLVTNLNNISSLVVEDKTQIVSLASIEKPSIDFKINEIYKIKNNIKKKYINIRYANDLTLHLLSKELLKYQIDFLNIEEENCSFDYFLDVKSDNNPHLDIPKIKCFEDRKLILKSNSYPKKLDEVYGKFQEKNKSQFMTVLAENELFDKSIVNFYISTKDDDGISYYSFKIDGLVDSVKTFTNPKSVKEFFEAVFKDEKGQKLLENYKNRFEEDYNKALQTDISIYSSKSFYNYWQIAKVILGFENSILENAKESFLEKGPRIDYKVFENKKLFNREFDYFSLIRSAMSFKLAGVDEKTISLGFVESLAHFIASEIDTISGFYDVDGVSLCGDMFQEDIFYNLVEKSITRNFKRYYNKEFVIQK